MPYRPSTRRRILAVAGLVVLAAIASGWYHLLGPGRYAEFEHIKDRLSQLPGVELQEAHGHEDVTFEIDGFTLQLEGHGRVAFGALSRRSFESTDHLALQALGDLQPIVVSEGYLGVYRADTGAPVRSTGYSWGIDVGPEGPFARFFPMPLARVQDVFEHYGAIHDALSAWPLQPAYGTFEDEHGTRYFYARKDPALDEDWIHPTELADE